LSNLGLISNAINEKPLTVKNKNATTAKVVAKI
jgi:hypothetical protein